MKLHILGSSSKGNGYILQSSTGASLIIECGVPLIEIKKSLNWRLSGVTAALVSHRHGDHAGYVREYSRAGIRIVAPMEVITENEPLTFSRSLMPNCGYVLGDFRVRTLPMTHANNDGTLCECFGYIIEHPEMGRTLFATDTIALPCAIRGLNHIMIEANYDDDILDANIAAGAVARDRLRLSHMEIKTVERMMKQLDMTDVIEIILLHLSDRNADRKSFAQRIANVTGKPCITAQKMIIDFDKQPY